MLDGAVANPALFQDDNAGADSVLVHPNLTGAAIMGEILAETLAPLVGSPYPVPAKDDSAWLTTNAYMDVGTGLATGFVESGGSIQAMVTPDGTAWQQFTLAGAGYVYCYAPVIAGLDLADLIADQTPIRCVCEIEIVSETCTSLALNAVIYATGFVQLCTAGHGTDTGTDLGVIAAMRGTLMSVAFPVPATAVTCGLTILARFSDAAVFRIRKFGFFKSFH